MFYYWSIKTPNTPDWWLFKRAISRQWGGYECKDAMIIDRRKLECGPYLRRPAGAHTYTWVFVLLVITCVYGLCAPSGQAPSPAAQAPAPSRAAAPRRAAPEETDAWYTQPGHSVINRSASPFNVSFNSCRLNEKQHVSCQFTDATGNDHWVYLPGLTWADVQKGKL
jgi:hypothetical protein